MAGFTIPALQKLMHPQILASIKNGATAILGLSMFDDLQEIPDGSRDSATRKFTKQITEDDTFRPIVSDAELNSYKISAIASACATLQGL